MSIGLHRVAVHRVPPPDDPAAPAHPLVEAFVHLDRKVNRELYGHDDFREPAHATTLALAGTPYLATHLWVALPEGLDPREAAADDAFGYAHVELPLAEERHLATVFVAVRRDVRRRGLGERLAAEVAGLLAAEGRTTILTWTAGPVVDADDPDALVPASGSGAVDGRAPASHWLVRLGFVLEQVERYSLLTLPDDHGTFLADLLARQRGSAGLAGPDYELVQWRDATPEPWQEPMAALRQRMSVDIPTAGLDFEEQEWDAERVRVADQRHLDRGRGSVTTAVRHLPSGELVAFTTLLWPRSAPAGVWQEDTLVAGHHRGRRLGMLVKTANLALLLAENPAAQRVHTWNAVENSFMLAINSALGFAAMCTEGAWQARLEPPAAG